MWLLIPFNPMPWAIGPVSTVRSGGKLRPIVGQNKQLRMYQDGIKEELEAQLVEAFAMIEGKIELRCYFWRKMEEYKTPQSRTARNHEADLTNMVKALEDALQGVMFKNDRDVIEQHNYIVEQSADDGTESKILIYVGTAKPDDPRTTLPIEAMAVLYPDDYPKLHDDASSAILLDDAGIDPEQLEFPA